MTWIFRVAYGTVVGESLWLEMAMENGGEVTKQSLAMKWRDGGHWELEVDAEISGEVRLEYSYIYKRDGIELREPEGRVWDCVSALGEQRVLFVDDWRSAGSEDRVYAAKVFDVVDGCGERNLGKVAWSGNHELNLQMARLPEGLVPCVLGGLDVLGDWDYSKAVAMVEVAENQWQLGLNLPLDWEVEYKYGLYDPALGKAVKLEDGEHNRLLEGREEADFVRVSHEIFRRSADLKFRAAGVAIPVFSLRSAEGCGVGEFADLKGMAEWAAVAGSAGLAWA